MGFVTDVAIAAEDDVCTLVPVRDDDGAFAPG
jgi:2-phosphosulfolactate phosphatase